MTLPVAIRNNPAYRSILNNPKFKKLLTALKTQNTTLRDKVRLLLKGKTSAEILSLLSSLSGKSGDDLLRAIISKLSPDQGARRVTVGALTFERSSSGEIFAHINGRKLKVTGKFKKKIDAWMRLRGSGDGIVTAKELKRAATVIITFMNNFGYSLLEAFNMYNDPATVFVERDQSAVTSARLALTRRLGGDQKRFASTNAVKTALRGCPPPVINDVTGSCGSSPTASMVAQHLMRQLRINESYTPNTVLGWLNVQSTPTIYRPGNPRSIEPNRSVKIRAPQTPVGRPLRTLTDLPSNFGLDSNPMEYRRVIPTEIRRNKVAERPVRYKKSGAHRLPRTKLKGIMSGIQTGLAGSLGNKRLKVIIKVRDGVVKDIEVRSAGSSTRKIILETAIGQYINLNLLTHLRGVGNGQYSFEINPRPRVARRRPVRPNPAAVRRFGQRLREAGRFIARIFRPIGRLFVRAYRAARRQPVVATPPRREPVRPTPEPTVELGRAYTPPEPTIVNPPQELSRPVMPVKPQVVRKPRSVRKQRVERVRPQEVTPKKLQLPQKAFANVQNWIQRYLWKNRANVGNISAIQFNLFFESNNPKSIVITSPNIPVPIRKIIQAAFARSYNFIPPTFRRCGNNTYKGVTVAAATFQNITASPRADIAAMRRTSKSLSRVRIRANQKLNIPGKRAIVERQLETLRKAKILIYTGTTKSELRRSRALIAEAMTALRGIKESRQPEPAPRPARSSGRLADLPYRSGGPGMMRPGRRRRQILRGGLGSRLGTIGTGAVRIPKRTKLSRPIAKMRIKSRSPIIEVTRPLRKRYKALANGTINKGFYGAMQYLTRLKTSGIAGAYSIRFKLTVSETDGRRGIAYRIDVDGPAAGKRKVKEQVLRALNNSRVKKLFSRLAKGEHEHSLTVRYTN
jgi:hypothetical protein